MKKGRKISKRLLMVVILLASLVPLSVPAGAQEADSASVHNIEILYEQFLQYYNSRDYASAIRVQQKIIEIQKRTIGEEHPAYANSLMGLANCYYSLGDYTKAIELYTRAQEIYKQVLGENHPSYAMSLNNLASCYYRLGNYSKAIELYTQALEIRKQVLGENHSDYASSLNNLATCYSDLGDYTKAIELYTRAQAIRKQVLGENHPDYAMSLNNLATCYSDLGDYTKAIELHEQALEIRKQVLGENHPDYAMSLSFLADCYSQLGYTSKAIDLGLKALEIQVEFNNKHYVADKSHDTMTVESHILNTNIESDIDKLQNEYFQYFLSDDYENAIKVKQQMLELQKRTINDEPLEYVSLLNDLATCYYLLGNKGRTIELHKEALGICKEKFGDGSLEYAKALEELAEDYELDDYNKAIELYSQALDIQKKALEEKDIDSNIADDYVTMLKGLADCYLEIKNYSKADELMTEAMETERRVLREPLELAKSLGHYADYYSGDGKYLKAIALNTEAMEIIKATQGDGHYDYAQSLKRLALNYADLGNYHKAIELNLQAQEIIKHFLGEEDLEYAKLLNNLATYYAYIGDNHKALEIGEKTLQIIKAKVGEDNVINSTPLSNMAEYYFHVGMYSEAIELGTKALMIRKEKFGDDPNTLTTLANCYFELCDYDSAIKLMTQAIDVCEETVGENHPDFANSVENLAYKYLRLGCYEKSINLLKQAFDIKQTFLLETMSGLTVQNRSFFWDKYSRGFHLLYPYALWAMDDTTLVGDLYDKSCLFAKGLLLATEVEMRKLVQESGNAEAMEKFNRMQMLRNMIAKQNERPIAERTLNTDSLEREAERLEVDVMRMSKEYGDFMRNLKLKWEDVQAKLGAEDVAVEFLSFPVSNDTTQYIALTVREGYSAPHLVPLFTSVELAAVRDQAYTGQEVSGLVWGRLAEELEGVKNIYFSPSGELYNIAIESMPHWEHDGMMGDAYGLYRLSSTRELAMAHSVVSSRGAIVYGGIKFNTSVPTMVSKSGKVGDEAHSMSDIYAMHVQKDRLARNLQESRGWEINDLPGTMTEAESVHKQLKSKLKKQDVVLLTGSDATEESFKRLSGNRDRVIHIATHGMYLKADQASDNRRKQQLSFLFHDDAGQGFTEDESLSRSCLLFSGARNTFNGADVKVPDSIDDGVLTAQEVSRLDLRGLDLLVLSACQTGLGDVTADGVMGLQRGFKKAGAQSIVMSLWSVDDAATRDMMEQFYKQLKPDLSNKREAFLNAQQDVRKNDDQYKYSDNPEIDARLRKTRPHWAAFILLDALK